MRRIVATLALVLVFGQIPRAAFAWGPEGHEVIALIADHYLDPAVRTKVQAMLGADTDPLGAHDMIRDSVWADKFRDSDSDTTKVHYTKTYFWHFAAIEIAGPLAGDADAACFYEPKLPPGVPASDGPEKDCIFHKIDEFSQELASPRTSPAERLLALKFLLHFVGDIHEPLNDTDNNNDRGNAVKVVAKGFEANSLKHFWDRDFVQALDEHSSADNPQPLADALLREITPVNVSTWNRDTAKDWAIGAHRLVQDDRYMRLAKGVLDQTVHLADDYVAAAEAIDRDQLKKAGVRLAYVLNTALK